MTLRPFDCLALRYNREGSVRIQSASVAPGSIHCTMRPLNIAKTPDRAQARQIAAEEKAIGEGAIYGIRRETVLWFNAFPFWRAAAAPKAG